MEENLPVKSSVFWDIIRCSVLKVTYQKKLNILLKRRLNFNCKRRYIPKDVTFHNHRSEDLKFNKFTDVSEVHASSIFRV
jgi:hypothetical protein